MKKFVALSMLIITLFLCGCEPIRAYFNYNEMINKVVKVEVVDQGDVGKVTKGEVLMELDETLIDDFLFDLSQIRFERYPIENVYHPSGISFCLTFKDGSYTVFDNRCASVSGYHTLHCSLEEYITLQNKYYPMTP